MGDLEKLLGKNFVEFSALDNFSNFIKQVPFWDVRIGIDLISKPY